MRFKGLFISILAGVFWLLCGLTRPAYALTPVEIADLSYKACPAEYGGMVAAGSIQEARCYLIVGKAINRSGKPVTNTDIFGRIYDANDNPVMQNRTRLGSIGEVPPGESPFELRVSVAANQPEPLQLKQFKASGFSGQVRR
ncbi:MAG: hypothetical protein ICV62_08835 [Cyanobacteria bacterium Co-bin13]|nr:hypothetical protein [Cyanobacteria bacterium Co-bin13]